MIRLLLLRWEMTQAWGGAGGVQRHHKGPYKRETEGSESEKAMCRQKRSQSHTLAGLEERGRGREPTDTRGLSKQKKQGHRFFPRAFRRNAAFRLPTSIQNCARINPRCFSH